MGGGRLAAGFHAGLLFADFEAWASFLINYKPLYFIAEIGISVNVGANIRIGIIHTTLSGSVHAQLLLQGPPFGGFVEVDFLVFHTKIWFGEANKKPDPLSFADFLEAVMETGSFGC